MSGTTSAERILAILDVFTEQRLEWTLDELMEQLGYSRPTLYRYLKTLKEAGLLNSTPSGRVTIGPRVVELDFLMQRSDPLLRHGKPHLRTLSEKYPCSTLLVRWYGSKLLCVASECSTPSTLSSYDRGRPMPIARGAISRAIMAFLPRRRLEPLIQDNREELASIGLGETTKQILDSMKAVRRAGYAIAHGEVTPGVVGIAAAVFDDGGAAIGALCLTIANTEVDQSRLNVISQEIRNSAQEITEGLANCSNSKMGEFDLDALLELRN